MGEWSKSIGEKGEKIVKFVFEQILDFNSLQENSSINCSRGKNHQSSDAKNVRSTHGVDGLISYKSPLEDNTLDIGVISSKFTAGEYPRYPTTQFKSHIKDLAHTLQCFNFSKEKSDVNRSFIGVNKTDIFGILVWLSNKSPINFDLSGIVSKVQIDGDLIFDKIILLDNSKVNFLYESIFRTREKFDVSKVDFVYHNSGLNFASIHEQSFGKVFPLNYLYSDIIPLRIQTEKNIELRIFINDDYSEDQLSQILTFAKTFDHLNSIDRTLLYFKTYDDLTDEKSVKQTLSNFPTYTLDVNLSLKKFPADFRN